MKRNQNLIPLSRQHHHMLVLAQVLKMDVPTYQNMPKSKEEKFVFLQTKLRDLIAPNFSLHRKILYPALIEWSFSDPELMDDLRQEEEDILISIQSLDIPDELELHEIGLSIEALVRKKERQLYQKVQLEHEQDLAQLNFN